MNIPGSLQHRILTKQGHGMICTRDLMVYHPQSAHFHRSPTLTEVAELSSLTHCSLDHSSLDGTAQSLKENLPLNINRNWLLKKINDGVVILRLRLYREKLARWKGHPPTWATLGEPTFHLFPYKTWRTVYTRNKKSARLDGWPGLAGLTLFDRRVTLLVGPIFLHTDTLARPAGSTRWRQSEHAQALF